jgi:hypothetical protein
MRALLFGAVKHLGQPEIDVRCFKNDMLGFPKLFFDAVVDMPSPFKLTGIRSFIINRGTFLSIDPCHAEALKSQSS